MTMVDEVTAMNSFDTHQANTVSRPVQINVSSITFFLKAVVVSMVVLGIARDVFVWQFGTGTVLKDLRHFSLDAERNLTSWYDCFTMTAAAILLGVIAAHSRSNDRMNTVHWTLLCFIFLAMSIDSTASFHEVTVGPLRRAFDLSGVFYFSWVILAAPLVVALALYFVPFLMRLPRGSALRFLFAGFVFVGGALGTEFICGYLATTAGMDSLAYRSVAGLQECLEAIGMTMFVIGLLRHIQSLTFQLQLELWD